MRRWDALMDRYVDEQVAAGRAGATVESLRRELERCGSWLKRRRPRPRLDEVGSDLLIQYLRSRSAFHSKNTLAGIMSKLRGWGEFLVREGVWLSNPLRWMKGPRRDPRSPLPRRISQQALAEVWNEAATSRYSVHRWTWVTVFGVLYGTGARRGEIARLDLADWNREEQLLQFDGRKTGRERRVPVPGLVWRCLEAYLPQRHNLLESLGRTDEPALFVNRFGTRMSSKAISSGMKRLAVRAGHERITLHQFRHSCASDLLEGGMHLAHVKQLLGHETIGTTVRYLHLADPHLHASVRKHPINTMLGHTTQEDQP